MAEKRKCLESDSGDGSKQGRFEWVLQQMGSEASTLYFCQAADIFYEQSANFYFKVDAEGNPQEVEAPEGFAFREEDVGKSEKIEQNKDVPLSSQATSDTKSNIYDKSFTKSVHGFRFHSESWMGHKTVNEDRFVNDLNLHDAGVLFGVFDGHGGSECADFITKEVGKYFKEHLSNTISTSKIKMDEISSLIRENKDLLGQLFDEESAELASQIKELLSIYESQYESERAKMDQAISDGFTAAFQSLDKDFLDVAIKNNPVLSCGSTAVVSVITGFHAGYEGARLIIANLGDSRAVLCRGIKGVPLSRDHKPDRRDEKRRITLAGGQVINVGGIWRVGPSPKTESAATSIYLAVSRSFGDISLKVPIALVSSEPEISIESLQKEDFFLVLACDGVFDVLTDQEVVDLAREHFGNPDQAAAAIVRKAFGKGSEDNLTATVIEFPWQTIEKYIEFEENEKSKVVQVATKTVDEDLDIFG